MADHHAALQAVGLRHVGNALNFPTTQICRVVQMNVYATVIPNGPVKQGFEVANRVAVNGRRVDTANDVHPHFKGCLHQRRGAGLNQQAALRKGHQLHVNQVLVLFPQRQHGLHVAQAPHRLHVHMAAEIQRAQGDAMLRQGAGTLGNRHVKVLQQDLFVTDAVVARGACRIGTPGHAPQGLVEMDMALHQGRQQQLALAVQQAGKFWRGTAHRQQRLDLAGLQHKVHRGGAKRTNITDHLGCRHGRLSS